MQQIPQMQQMQQQPMQYPGQINMIQPGVTVPVQQVGYYGAQRQMNRANMHQ